MANPYVIGTVESGATTTSVIPVTTAPGLHDNVVIAAQVFSSGTLPHVNTVTDTKGNTYVPVTSDTTQVSTYMYRLEGQMVQLTTSDTITVTWSGASGVKNSAAIGIPGVMPAADKVPATVNSASSGTGLISSGTLTESNEVIITIVSQGANATGPSWNAGPTVLTTLTQASSPYMAVAYQVVNTNASVTSSVTFAAKFCMLMATFIVPAASFPYLIGEAQAPSGGSTALTVPLQRATAQGDTIYVGALVTSGSIASVTDVASNTYTQVPGSPAGSAGLQVSTWASYNSDPMTPGVLGGGNQSFTGTPGLVGSTCAFKVYKFLYTAANSSSGCVFTMGATVQHSLPNGTKIKFVDGTPPGGFSTGTTYFVVSSTGNKGAPTFKLAGTAGGSPIGGSGNGGLGSLTFQIADGTYAASQPASSQEMDLNIDAVAGFTGGFAHGPGSSQKFYYGGAGAWPVSTLSGGAEGDVTALMATGLQVWLCLGPNPNGSDAATLTSMLQFWNSNANVKVKPKVVFYQEYHAGSQTDYINTYKNYYSTCNAQGNKVVVDGAGSAPSKWTTWFPGKNYCDEIALDYYGSTWKAQTKSGTTNLDPTLPMRQLADSNGKPFGFGEIGQAVWNAGASLSDTLFVQYMQYLTTIMSQRLQQGLTNSDVMWYNGFSGGNPFGADGNTILPGDWRIPLLQTLYNSLTTGSPQPPPSTGVTVNYSTNASVQAAVAVGDNNVNTSGSDKIVSASGTGTTASVATGTLSQAEEHIIAFVADAAAGGDPVFGDGLTNLGSDLEVGTTGWLKAGFKTVNTTASDTPSATLTSAAWVISVVTDAVSVPVITTNPTEGFVGTAYSFQMQATGGVGALTWAWSGTTPPGLSFNSAGLISGTPTTAGSFNTTFTATDSLGLQGTLTVNIIIVGQTGGGGSGATAPTVGSAPPTPLPGNILSLADSDSEVSTGYTWASFANANAPFQSSATSITGSFSTQWTVPSSVSGEPYGGAFNYGAGPYGGIAGGLSQISTGAYPVVAGQTYVASLFLLSGANRQVQLGIAWYDASNTLIGTVSQGTIFGSVPGGWTPLTFASAAPGLAVSAKLIVTVNGATTGDTYNIELAYLAPSHAQVLIDWNNPTFQPGSAAGQLFMDVTPFVRFDPGITYTRGRQDAISDIQPGSASFKMLNDLGTFARFSTTSIPSVIGGNVTLQRRCQINAADENGLWQTRFDGAISEIGYEFDNTGNTSNANISLTDILADLSRQDPLFCWTKEQVLVNNPIYHWTLDDPGNVGGAGPAGAGKFGNAAETSGNNGPPLRLTNSDGTNTATIAWQSTTGGVETLADAVAPAKPDGSEFWVPGSNQPTSLIRGLDAGTVGPYTTPLSSVYFTPVRTAKSAQNTFVGNTGFMLSAELPTPIAPTSTGADYSVEAYFTMDPAVGTNLSANFGPYVVLGLGTSRTFTNLVAGLYLNAGALKFEVATYSQPPAFLGLNFPGAPAPTVVASTSTAMTADTIQRPHHLVITFSGDPSAPLVIAWLDGTSIGSFTLPMGQIYDTITVGGAYGGCGAYFGNISCVSVYNYALSAQQIITDCQYGQYGTWEMPCDDVMSVLSVFAAVPTFWSGINGQHFGLTLSEYIDITGSNALSAMQTVEKAENGLLFVAANGSLNFHTRDWRMGYGPPDLLLPPNTFDANMQYELVDQFLVNEMAVSGPSTLGATQNLLTQSQQQVTGPLDTVANGILQAGFINAASQNQYGVYAPNPVSSPIALPLITLSRAYAQLGLAAFQYWPDPNLIDIAAWNANSRGDPYLIPAQLTVDLLTLDPNITETITDESGGTATVPLGISFFYGLEIDNMIAPLPGTLPVSMPNSQAPVEWFIEGISETISVNARTITFFTSPAQAQRAWIPGDPTYGVLGSTTRIGISQADLSTPQADGKDVGHDAGPPYWPPTFGATMNNPDGSGNGFVGALDMRGLAGNLSLLLQPPLCVVSALSQTQSITNGSLTNPVLNWDTIHVDSAAGMGLLPGYPAWYVVTVPGWYEINASVQWANTTGSAGYTAQAWIVVAQAAAQWVAGGGTNTPLNVGQYVCPVGEAVRFNSNSMPPVCCASTRMYLGLGDMVAIGVEQNFTAARSTGTSPVGSSMSIRLTGIGQKDDRAQINSSIANGGTVTSPTPGTPGTKTYQNLHTYSYQGPKGFAPYQRRNTDIGCYQGTKGSGLDSEGSQASVISFNASQMQTDLTGHTLVSVTLTTQNVQSWYSQGAKLMLGWTKVAPGGSSFQIRSSTSTVNVIHQFFAQGQTLTFTIPNSLFQQFLTGGATALVIGDDQTTDLNYYGQWVGGPNTWTLTVNFR